MKWPSEHTCSMSEIFYHESPIDIIVMSKVADLKLRSVEFSFAVKLKNYKMIGTKSRTYGIYFSLIRHLKVKRSVK